MRPGFSRRAAFFCGILCLSLAAKPAAAADSAAAGNAPRAVSDVRLADQAEVVEDFTVVEEAPVAAEPDPLFDDDFDLGPPPQPDPFEGINRQTHRFNQGVDRFVLDPITWAYRKVTPRVVRDSLLNFFSNLTEPTTVVNDLLQREWDDASIAFTRIVVNSTLGLGGLFDPAAALDLEPHASDFGQTMALAGVGSGPYVVLPVLGPSNVRDGVGLAVDVVFRPSTFVVPLADQIVFTAIQGGGFGFTLREQEYDKLQALKESSVDYYAALRSAYSQHRSAVIWERREHHRGDTTNVEEVVVEEVEVRDPASSVLRTSHSRPPRGPRSRPGGASSRTRTVAARSR